MQLKSTNTSQHEGNAWEKTRGANGELKTAAVAVAVLRKLQTRRCHNKVLKTRTICSPSSGLDTSQFLGFRSSSDSAF